MMTVTMKKAMAEFRFAASLMVPLSLKISMVSKPCFKPRALFCIAWSNGTAQWGLAKNVKA